MNKIPVPIVTSELPQRGKREEGGETKGRIPHGYRLTPAGLRAFTALS